MAIQIEMPKLSDTMTEGTVVKWHRSVGDSIEFGDVIAEIETDKATMEMEASDDGTITDIKVQEGGKAEIGAVIAVLDGDGSDCIVPLAESQVHCQNTPWTSNCWRVSSAELRRQVSLRKKLVSCGLIISGTAPPAPAAT